MTRYAVGDDVEKFTGDYGGPGKVVCVGIDEAGKPLIGVSFAIAGGFGKFVHFLREHQIRHRPKASEGGRDEA